MRNQFAGPCYRCGDRVDPGDGHFERYAGNKWRTQHAYCAIRWRGVWPEPTQAQAKAERERQLKRG